MDTKDNSRMILEAPTATKRQPKKLRAVSDPLGITEKACLREDKDLLMEALMENTMFIWDGKGAAFQVFGRVECNGIATTMDRIPDNKDVAPGQQRFHKLLRYKYGMKAEQAWEIEEYVRKNNDVFNPITTLRDGKNFIFWEEGRAHIDMYCDGMFRYIPGNFIKYPAADFDVEHYGMLRYLMRMSGVKVPEGSLPLLNDEGLEEMREWPEFNVFEYDMKTDAAKVAKPHRAMHIIRTLVGDSGVGKTKRARLMTQLFGEYAHMGSIMGEKQFHDDDHPYVVKVIDEATRMKVTQQKRLEQLVTAPELRINRKYQDVVTWGNPTFYWVTANQMRNPEDDFRVVGPNQRWMLRQPVGNAIDFQNDVGWAMLSDGQWSMAGLNTYMDILSFFYNPSFWPVPSVEASKTYSNKAPYQRHMTGEGTNSNLGNSLGVQMVIAKIFEELLNREIDDHFEVFKAEYTDKTFTAGNFKKIFEMNQSSTGMCKFLLKFTVDTGVEFVNHNSNVRNFIINDWKLFEAAIKYPTDDNLGDM